MTPSMVVVVWRSSAWIRPWLFDGAVAGLVATLVLVERGLPWPIKACGLLMALFLIWRRHIPVTVLAVVYVLAPVHLLMNSYVRLFDVAVLIAMYSVVLYRPQARWGVIAGAGGAIGVLVAATVEEHRSGNFWVVFWVVGAVTVTTWVTAHGVRTRRLYVQTLEERTATLERERDHLALLALAEERAAIAREIHDVVAHSLSVMIVQADAAGYTLDGPQEPARQALDTIASTGREALDDMSRVVRLLRGTPPRSSDGDPDEGVGGEGGRRAIGLKEVDGLVARSGLRVTRHTVGTPGRLSAAQEVTAYRIIQESLTNTLRHAGPDASVELRLVFAAKSLRVEVTDDGGGRCPAGARPGRHAGTRDRARRRPGGGTPDGRWLAGRSDHSPDIGQRGMMRT